MKKKDWQPELYLKFNSERIQPSIDLVSRINYDNPQKIIDIGCGPGNSTQILVQRWPEAKITGIDNSPAMIEKAKKDYPDQGWKLKDAGKDDMQGNYDIVFSNATIQWIPNHEALIKKFCNLLTEKGLLAVQIPLFWEMKLGKAIANIAEDKRWSSVTKAATTLFTIHNYSFYYYQLSRLFNSLQIWVTSYMHIMESHSAILEMIRSTGLKPYHEHLDSEKDIDEFDTCVLNSIKSDYPQQKNGKVIFPFKRLFFIAQK